MLSSTRCSRIKPENNSVPSARTCHVGATYKNQLVIYGGGESGKTAVNDTKLYIYNGKTRKWAALSLQGGPGCRHGHVMISDDAADAIYLHGGMSEDKIFDDLWKIDMKKLCWSSLTSSTTYSGANNSASCSMPCARAAHGGVSIQASLFVFGGLAETGLALDDLWKYDTGKKYLFCSLLSLRIENVPRKVDEINL